MFVGKDLLEFINNPNVVGGVKDELPMPDSFSSKCLSFKKWHGYMRLSQSLMTGQLLYFQNAYLKHIYNYPDHNQDLRISVGTQTKPDPCP